MDYRRHLNRTVDTRIGNFVYAGRVHPYFIGSGRYYNTDKNNQRSKTAIVK